MKENAGHSNINKSYTKFTVDNEKIRFGLGSIKNVGTAAVDEIVEERRKNGRKGGIASGIARNERKTLKEQLLILLENGDTQKEVSLALISKALTGDTKAFEVIRDTIGEKPKEQVEQKQEVKIVMDDKLEEWGK